MNTYERGEITHTCENVLVVPELEEGFGSDSVSVALGSILGSPVSEYFENTSMVRQVRLT